MGTLQQLSEGVKKGKRDDVRELTQQALDANMDPQEVLDALTGAMSDIGEKFKNNEVYVPEVLIAARAMKEAMGVLEPKLVDAGIKPEYRVVIGTVKGDLHDIGKNLVAMMLKGANFEVIDLGVNVESEKFVSAAKENNAQLIAMSALLTTTMTAMRDTVDALKVSGLNDVQIMVGGAPVTQDFSDEIGANGYAPDAASAVDLAKQLVSA